MTTRSADVEHYAAERARRREAKARRRAEALALPPPSLPPERAVLIAMLRRQAIASALRERLIAMLQQPHLARGRSYLRGALRRFARSQQELRALAELTRPPAHVDAWATEPPVIKRTVRIRPPRVPPYQWRRPEVSGGAFESNRRRH